MALLRCLDGATVSIAPDFSTANFRLVSMGKELLQQVQEGEELTMRGCDKDGMVMCTSSATFRLQVVESSNTSLLLQAPEHSPPSQLATQQDCPTPLVAIASTPDVIEAVRTAPRLARLHDMLAAAPYAGQSANAGHTRAEIEAAVQCSPKELEAALDAEGALEWQGRIAVLDLQYFFALADAILTTAVEQGWALSALVPSDVHAAMQARVEGGSAEAAPALEVVAHALRLLARETRGHGAVAVPALPPCSDFSQPLSLSPSQVARTRGHEVLAALQAASAGGSMQAQEFVLAWQATLAMHSEVRAEHCCIETLAGLALLHGGVALPAGEEGVLEGSPACPGADASTADVISFFPHYTLPASAPERFAALFAERTLWRLEDMLPYLQALVGPGSAVSDLLLLHTRYVTQGDGSKLYCAR